MQHCAPAGAHLSRRPAGHRGRNRLHFDRHSLAPGNYCRSPRSEGGCFGRRRKHRRIRNDRFQSNRRHPGILHRGSRCHRAEACSCCIRWDRSSGLPGRDCSRDREGRACSCPDSSPLRIVGSVRSGHCPAGSCPPGSCCSRCICCRRPGRHHRCRNCNQYNRRRCCRSRSCHSGRTCRRRTPRNIDRRGCSGFRTPSSSVD